MSTVSGGLLEALDGLQDQLGESTGSVTRSSDPDSARLNSRSSATSRWNRRTSTARRSTVWRVRSSKVSRRASSISVVVARVVSGDRSSWLTSEAKRASRAMRCSRAEAMRLNESVRGSRSGSPWASRRVVELAARDVAGCRGHVGDRTQDAACGPPTDEGGGDGRDGRCSDERVPDDVQRVVQLGEEEQLVVLRACGGER